MNRLLSLTFASLFLLGAARASVTETIQQNHPITADGTLELRNINGNVDVSAWDKNEVEIEAVKTAPDKDNLDDITVEIAAKPDSVTIETKHARKWFGGSRGGVTYKLHVPATLQVKKLSCVNSSVSIKGVQGPIHANTVNGNVQVKDAGAKLELHSVNGSVEAVVGSKVAAREFKLETINGSVELTGPADFSAKIDLSTVNGGKKCEYPVTISDSGRHHLKGTIGSGAAEVRLHSVNGSVTLNKS